MTAHFVLFLRLGILLSLPLFVSGQQLPRLTQTLAELRLDLQQYQLETGLARATRLVTQYPEVLELRELLFAFYLNKGIFQQSAAELVFIRQRRDDEQTQYLTAQLALARGKAEVNAAVKIQYLQQSVILALAIVQTHKRFLPPRLLLCETYILLGNLRAARTESDVYSSIGGEDRDWFYCTLKLELATTPLPVEILRSLFARYEANFARDAHYFALAAVFAEQRGAPQQALKALDQALYLYPQHPEYVQHKQTLLYQLGAYQELAAFIGKLPQQTAAARATALYTEALLYFLDFREHRAAPMPAVPPAAQALMWRFAPEAQPQDAVYAKLEAALSAAPEQEVFRFFYEELVRANTAFTAHQRGRLAETHTELARRALARGAEAEARVYFLRALSLAPQNLPLRKQYAAFLKTTKQLRRYGEELSIIETLATAEPDEEQATVYKREAARELIGKATRTDLETRYQVRRDEHIREGAKLLVVTTQPPQQLAAAKLFYLERIFSAMLMQQLSHSLTLQPEAVAAAELERTLAAAEYDAVLTYQVTLEAKQLRLTYRLVSAVTRELITESSIAVSANRRFFKTLLTLTQQLERALLKRGRILRIDEHKLLLSLGREQLPAAGAGGKPLPVFYVQQAAGSTAAASFAGPFPITQLEERVSLGEVRNSFMLRELELGAAVIVRAEVLAK